MANVLGNLVVQLTAQTDAFARGMTDAKKLAFTTSGEIVDSLKRVGDQLTKLKFGSTSEWEKSGAIIGGVVAGIGVAVATSSIVVAKEVAEQIKQMSKLSQSYGLSIETVSQLRVASKLTGVDMETLTMGLGRLAKASAAAAEGHKTQAAAFAQLNIRVADGQGHLLPMNQLLPELADRFSKLQDGTGKTALAMQLFGRSGAALIPFLNRGKEGIQQMLDLSDQLGITWSEKDAKSAEIFQQRVEILDLKTTALKENFVKGLLPALDQISTAFVSTDKNGNSAANTLGNALGTALKYTTVGVASLVAEWRELLVVIDLRKWGKDAQDEFNKIEAGFQKFANDILNPKPLSVIAAGAGAGTGTPTFHDLTGAKNPDQGITELLDKARQLFNKTQGDSLATQVSNIEQLKIKLQQFAALHPDQIFLDINAAVEKLNVAEGELIAKYQGALQAELNKGATSQIAQMLSAPSSVASASGQVQSQSQLIDLTKDLNEQNRQRLQIFGQTRTPLERYMADVGTLNLLYQDKSSDEYLRSLRDANERLTEAYNPAIKLQKAMEELNDAYRVGAISVAYYKQQVQQLEAQQALAATVTNPKSGLGGVRQGVGAGVAGLSAEWRGAAAEIAQSTMQIGHAISQNMGHAITDMITGTKSVGQAFAEMGRNILTSIVGVLADMLARWIVTHILMSIVHKSATVTQAVSVATSNFGQAQSAAFLGAANAYAFWAWNPPIAAAMAGAALAVGESFAASSLGAGLAGAAKGGALLSEDSLIAAGANEMVLPVNLSKGLQGMIAAFNSPSAGSGHRSTGAGGNSYSNSFSGGPMTIHVNGARDPGLTAAKVGSVVRGEIRRQARRFGVS